ncbi:MAG TPA: threonine aldolase, partial [Candidatus Cloacimonas sp.]|nr:threonine aldolase [Candidatus Cloacimonas sp.]
MSNKRGFASDNNSGVHPRLLQALQQVNVGHTIAYGDDDYTHAAQNLLKQHFGETAQSFFVY